MNGAGNDFILVDNRQLRFALSRATIAQLCHRHRGVGADGLIAVEPAPDEGTDFTMRYYNSDGGEAEMCGNGARCFARFAASLMPGNPETITFHTLAGRIGATLHLDGTVELAMSQPHSFAEPIELTLEDPSRTQVFVHFLNTGVPHAVVFMGTPEELEFADVATLGRALRHHPHFAPAGTNANFAAVLGPSSLRLRTYERGVEAETLACGTGVVATALLHHLQSGDPSPISVRVQGGDTLTVRFTPLARGTFQGVFLRGPAEKTFQGEVALPD